MAKLRGTVRRSDLEGGTWQLETDQGERYQLTGKLDGARDGGKVELDGKVDRSAMSFQMTAPIFKVNNLKALP